MKKPAPSFQAAPKMTMDTMFPPVRPAGSQSPALGGATMPEPRTTPALDRSRQFTPQVGLNMGMDARH